MARQNPPSGTYGHQLYISKELFAELQRRAIELGFPPIAPRGRKVAMINSVIKVHLGLSTTEKELARLGASESYWGRPSKARR